MEIKGREKSPYTGGTSRSRFKQDKNKKQIERFVSKYPPIDYEKYKIVPEISVTIRFDQARSDFNNIDFKFPYNVTIKNIVDKIKERHCFSCRNVKIYTLENSQKKYLCDYLYKTFEDLKIPLTENMNVFYEYEPVESPLLEAGLA